MSQTCTMYMFVTHSLFMFTSTSFTSIAVIYTSLFGQHQHKMLFPSGTTWRYGWLSPDTQTNTETVRRHTYTHKHTHTQVTYTQDSYTAHTYTYIHTHVYIHTFIHTYIYIQCTYIHTYIHVHTYLYDSCAKDERHR